jgi:drug/metabolite transporter (DMT)-like permease
LNLEGVFTALLAWFVFKENFDRRMALGMAAIVAGGGLLSWAGRPEIGIPWGTIFIAGACLAWAMDNNLTRKVSSADPNQIAAAKGLVAGVVNLFIALAVGMTIPRVTVITSAALLGFLSYGVSLTLFVLALRHMGTARSTAPFVGAVLSFLILRNDLTIAVVVAAVLMAIGVWLHLTERHQHEHVHEAKEHDHRQSHDEHHQHHDDPALLALTHTHVHRHKSLRHAHSHYPDNNQRHEH